MNARGSHAVLLKRTENLNPMYPYAKVCQRRDEFFQVRNLILYQTLSYNFSGVQTFIKRLKALKWFGWRDVDKMELYDELDDINPITGISWIQSY